MTVNFSTQHRGKQHHQEIERLRGELEAAQRRGDILLRERDEEREKLRSWEAEEAKQLDAAHARAQAAEAQRDRLQSGLQNYRRAVEQSGAHANAAERELFALLDSEPGLPEKQGTPNGGNGPGKEQGDCERCGGSKVVTEDVRYGLKVVPTSVPCPDCTGMKRGDCSTGDCSETAVASVEVEASGWHRYCRSCAESLAGIYAVKWDCTGKEVGVGAGTQPGVEGRNLGTQLGSQRAVASADSSLVLFFSRALHAHAHGAGCTCDAFDLPADSNLDQGGDDARTEDPRPVVDPVSVPDLVSAGAAVDVGGGPENSEAQCGSVCAKCRCEREAGHEGKHRHTDSHRQMRWITPEQTDTAPRQQTSHVEGPWKNPEARWFVYEETGKYKSGHPCYRLEDADRIRDWAEKEGRGFYVVPEASTQPVEDVIEELERRAEKFRERAAAAETPREKSLRKGRAHGLEEAAQLLRSGGEK